MSEVYLGNPNLKKANTPIQFTQEKIVEFLKCKNDPVYFFFASGKKELGKGYKLLNF